jgi:hypothetical protein
MSLKDIAYFIKPGDTITISHPASKGSITFGPEFTLHIKEDIDKLDELAQIMKENWEK